MKYLVPGGLFILAAIFLFGLPAKNKLNASELLNKTLAACADQDRAKSILCFKETMEPFVTKQGISPFLEALENRFVKNDEAAEGGITHCHDLTHAIGQVAGTNANNLAATLKECTKICTFGCYHGVVEGFLSSGRNFETEIPNLCRADRGFDAGKQSACFHGIGHGAASIGGFELKKAFANCDRIPTREGRRDCGSGVIMELYEPSSFSHATLEFPADIPAFCKTLREPYDEVCRTTAGLHEFARFMDSSSAFRTCELVPAQYQRPCVVSIGQNFYFAFHGNMEKIDENCRLAKNSPGREACIEGVLTSIVFSDPAARRGAEFCKLQEDFRSYCLTTIENMTK